MPNADVQKRDRCDSESVFGRICEYYDLLYGDKEYDREVQYVCGLLGEFGNQNHAVLEFGSGTGRHGSLLADCGYQVKGIERSPEMLKVARQRIKHTAAGSFECELGDFGTTRLTGRFGCVLALFHVVSYLTTDESIQSAFKNVARHLDDGGVFIFDVWHAPAVLTQRPSVRIKRVKNNSMRLTRIAEPTLFTEANCVQVDFTLFVDDDEPGKFSEYQESHLLRYFSRPEINSIACRNGFEVVNCEEWLTRATPGAETWGVCYVLRKVAS